MEKSTSTKILDVLTLILKILIVIAYLIITLILAYVEISEIINYTNNPEVNNVGMVFALVIILMGFISYGAVMFISLIGLILSLFNKYSKKRKKHLIFFVLSFIIPVLTESLLILIYSIAI